MSKTDAAALKQKQTDVLAGLYEKYELYPTDFFAHKHYQIIKREGIEKIMDVEEIHYDLDTILIDEVSCVVKGKYWKEDEEGNIVGRIITTYGTANRGNSQTTYFAEMAEKRCNSRGVLKLIKAYQLGIMGEDEMDERDEEFKRSRQATPNSGGALFKGQG